MFWGPGAPEACPELVEGFAPVFWALTWAPLYSAGLPGSPLLAFEKWPADDHYPDGVGNDPTQKSTLSLC
jgi:hypothetical protein